MKTGRPKIKPEFQRRDIGLTLSPAIIERTRNVCDLAGWSFSGVTEKALIFYLNALDRHVRAAPDFEPLPPQKKQRKKYTRKKIV